MSEFEFGQKGWCWFNHSGSGIYPCVYKNVENDKIRVLIETENHTQLFDNFSIEEPTTKPVIKGFELVEIEVQSNNQLTVLAYGTTTPLSMCQDIVTFAGFVYEKKPDKIKSQSRMWLAGGHLCREWRESAEIVFPKYVAFKK